MAPTSCTDPAIVDLDDHERDALFDIARASIRHGLTSDQPLAVQADDMVGRLADPLGSFVSVFHRQLLRGCIGNLAASRPLAQGVAYNAYHAAFSDHRFEPLIAEELVETLVEISLLSAPEPIDFESEIDLHDQLEPLIDGVILMEAERRATFLPKVWENLAEPADFIRELKRKAGLPADYWSGTISFARYRATTYKSSY
ncbi:MAG: AmmeMemoRadiSam system protein A [Gammaproteobacteria bacterium]|nr:AmmeMemoRadiSam system protein A [Gammaproteobacteria bacterium]